MKNKSVIIPLFLLSWHVTAADTWIKDQTYTSGDVVEWNGTHFLSSSWSNGTEPVVNNINWDGWITLDAEKIAAWKQENVYLGGDVAEFNSEYYLSKWWNKGEIPNGSSAWQPIDVSFLITPDPGPETPKDKILGVDTNNDGLRDDYAEVINNTYVEPEEIKLAEAAGKEWHKLVEFGVSGNSIDYNDAKYMIDNIVFIEMCVKEYHTNNEGYVNPFDFYFDSIPRALEKTKAENKLSRVLADYIVIFDESFCSTFQK